ncbi:TetR/AcrR family transcriptional regulator [Acinetobacter gyllenbergii]|uniref:TetR/AcrR family transcriptional regulator n=1 Tax=Acinetobacter gyllenbergii TaxID=134534 RepID=UPI0003BF8FF5|nr:TetR/AcrR family transcriptional regulator [Acinetobacter gyllenbergii]ESK54750.1 hypothetical protein F987_00710 [Acinetobacter gyllenbergii NIPH 230]
MSKKEKVLDTALSIYYQYSFNTIGIDRIILESGVAKMTFYKYFPCKEILIEACLKRMSEKFKEEITGKINSIQDNDYIGKIKSIFDWYINWFKSESFNGCMFQKATAEVLSSYPSIIKPIKNYKVWLCHTMIDLLLKLNIYRPQILSSIFINILDGMIVYATTNQDHIKIESLWEYIEKLIHYDRITS